MGKKYDMVFIIEYFDKETEFLVKHELIENCTIKDVKQLLMEIFNSEEPIGITKNGQEFIIGGYEITPLIKEKILIKFGIDVDIENYDCFLAQEHRSDI
jgi:hypothetical protein